jgi:hypothetical protein
MADTLADTFRRFTDPWSTGAVAALDDLCAPELIYHVLPFPDMGYAELKQFIAAFHMGFPDFQVIQDENLSVGQTTIHRWTITGTFSAASPLLPAPPTGKRGRVAGCHIIRWQNNRAVEVWHYGDWLGWLQQVGVLPPLSGA